MQVKLTGKSLNESVKGYNTCNIERLLRTLCKTFFSTALAITACIPCYAFRADDPLQQTKASSSHDRHASLPRSITTEQLKAEKLAITSRISVEWHPRFGTPISVRGMDLTKLQDVSGRKQLSLTEGNAYESNSIAVLNNLKGLFSFKNAVIFFVTIVNNFKCIFPV